MGGEQSEFLFADGAAPALPTPDLRSELYAEIAALWLLPLGQRVQVELRGHDFADLQGCLELCRSPALPLQRGESLALRIGTIEFSSGQLVSWCVV